MMGSITAMGLLTLLIYQWNLLPFTAKCKAALLYWLQTVAAGNEEATAFGWKYFPKAYTHVHAETQNTPLSHKKKKKIPLNTLRSKRPHWDIKSFYIRRYKCTDRSYNLNSSLVCVTWLKQALISLQGYCTAFVQVCKGSLPQAEIPVGEVRKKSFCALSTIWSIYHTLTLPSATPLHGTLHIIVQYSGESSPLVIILKWNRQLYPYVG